MSMPIPEEALSQIKEAVVRGRKIEAIRMYREFTGAGLAEAKNAVEQLEEKWRVAEPDAFAAEPESDGQPPIKLVAGVPFGCLLGAIPFVVFGLVLLAWGVQSGLSLWAFTARAAATQGTVVRLDNRIPGQGHSNTQCRAVVSYQVGGQTHEVYGYLQMKPGASGWPKGFQVGDLVNLRYDPDRPAEAKLDSSYVWVGPLIPGAIGLIFLLLGVGLIWSERRKRRVQWKPTT
jgi:hypothetical protein